MATAKRKAELSNQKIKKQRTIIIIMSIIIGITFYLLVSYNQDGNKNFLYILYGFLSAIVVEILGALVGIAFLDDLSKDETIAKINSVNEKIDDLEEVNKTVIELIKLKPLIEIKNDQEFIEQIKNISFLKDQYKRFPDAALVIGDIGEKITNEFFDIQNGIVKFYTETQRKQAIVGIYNHIEGIMDDKLPNSEILAVTWDVYDYFINYWGEDDINAYINRNKRVADLGVKIRRIFVVNRNNFDISKKNRLKTILSQTNHNNIETKWVYEDQMKTSIFNEGKSSFLLVGTATGYKIATESIGTHNDRLYMDFNSRGKAIQLKDRFFALYNIQDNPIEDLS